MTGASLSGWIEPGSAADLRVSDVAAARSALEGWEGVDLIALPRGRDIRLFVADMDSTMIGQECIDELADYAGVKPQVADITERAMRGELDFVGALRERVALLEGLPEATIAQCLKERVTLNPGAGTLVRTLTAEGVRTLLVSGGFTAFAEPVGELIGFDEVEANVLEVAGGVLTGKVSGRIVDSGYKKAALIGRREHLSLGHAQTMAIGDGANDLPMVEEAGFGLAYRAKPVLAASADARLDNHPLSALLWALGIPSDRWIQAG
ncbi:phosphoserine phosphatase SerB [Sphingomonas jaspsi]|uniref:phosphoserine phosphatase SerB n=1 Tax=Sphingomonas jaspsi TaxID=392409 RepID=UPI00316ACFB1